MISGATDGPPAAATHTSGAPAQPATNTTDNVTAIDVEMSTDQPAKTAAPKAVPLMDYIHNVVSDCCAIQLIICSFCIDHCGYLHQLILAKV